MNSWLKSFITIEEEPGLGTRFTKAVEEATSSALALPLAGSPASKNTRRVFLKDFPFSVVYQPTAGGIIVFALAHHSLRPGYWRTRLQER